MPTPSADQLREQARELVARLGDSALTFAEWKADALEEAGNLDEARVWKMIAGTVMAIIEI
jgi:hypothetical protein